MRRVATACDGRIRGKRIRVVRVGGHAVETNGDDEEAGQVTLGPIVQGIARFGRRVLSAPTSLPHVPSRLSRIPSPPLPHAPSMRLDLGAVRVQADGSTVKLWAFAPSVLKERHTPPRPDYTSSSVGQAWLQCRFSSSPGPEPSSSTASTVPDQIQWADCATEATLDAL